MAQSDVDTINWFSNRSDRTVIWITVFFAVGGAVLEIAGSLLSALFRTNGGLGMFWGMWIPFCFLTIPPIHYLCRQVRTMRKRIDDLEKMSNKTTET